MKRKLEENTHWIIIGFTLALVLVGGLGNVARAGWGGGGGGGGTTISPLTAGGVVYGTGSAASTSAAGTKGMSAISEGAGAPGFIWPNIRRELWIEPNGTGTGSASLVVLGIESGLTGAAITWSTPASAVATTYRGTVNSFLAARADLNGTVTVGGVTGPLKDWAIGTLPVMECVWTSAVVNSSQIYWCADTSAALTTTECATTQGSSATHFAGVCGRTSVTANFQCCAGNGTNNNCTDTGVPATFTAPEPVYARVDASVAGTITCTVVNPSSGGVTNATVSTSTTVPTGTGTDMGPIATEGNTNSTANQIYQMGVLHIRAGGWPEP